MPIDLHFRVVQSTEHAGFDLVIATDEITGEATWVTIGPVPGVDEAAHALVASLTTPMIDQDRISVLEESTAAISALLDRVAELEGQLGAIQQQTAETRDAMINLMARGGTAVSPVAQSPGGTSPPAPRRPAAQPPGRVEPGFVGTFRRDLTSYIHAGPGQFPAGVFGRSSATAKTILGPEEEE